MAHRLTLALPALIACVLWSACGPTIPKTIPPQAPTHLTGPEIDLEPYKKDEAPEGPITFHILHTNDMHGQITPRKARWLDRDNPPMVGGLHALARYINQTRANVGDDKVILLDSGDIFAGTPEGNLTKGQIMVDFMNAMRYDAMALGNHEFDQGAQVLADLDKAAQFSILAANLAQKPAIIDNSLNGVVSIMSVFERQGVKIGIVGVITPDTPQMTHKDAGALYDFMDPVLAIEDAVSTLKLDGADLVLVVSHVGVEGEKIMIDKAPEGVVAIFGGHSHTQLDPMIRSDKTGVVLLQTRGKTSAINHLVIEVNGDEVKVIRGAPQDLLALNVPEDPQVAAIIARYAPAIEKRMAEKVGTCPQTLLRAQRGELASSTLGNFIADVMRTAGKAQIGLTNKTGIRADIEKGDVTIRSLYNAAPFDNSVVVVSLTGAQIKEVLEYSVKTSRTYIELSGATALVDLKRPEGERVVEIKVGGKPLDPKSIYTLATNSFLADGGDGHAVLKAGSKSDSGVMMRDALADWLRANKTCPIIKDTRIKAR